MRAAAAAGGRTGEKNIICSRREEEDCLRQGAGGGEGGSCAPPRGVVVGAARASSEKARRATAASISVLPKAPRVVAARAARLNVAYLDVVARLLRLADLVYQLDRVEVVLLHEGRNVLLKIIKKGIFLLVGFCIIIDAKCSLLEIFYFFPFGLFIINL